MIGQEQAAISWVKNQWEWKKRYLMLAAHFVCGPAAALTLSPGEPVPIVTTMSGVQGFPVAVSGSSDGFLAVWMSGAMEPVASFSAAGDQTWTTPVSIDAGTINQPCVGYNDSGFVATWIRAIPGVAQGNAYASLSTDNGLTWSSPVILCPAMGDGSNVITPAEVAGSSAGFLAAWNSFDTGSVYNAWTSFSSDGLTWSPAVQAVSDVTMNQAIVDVAAFGSTFVISYQSLGRSAEVGYITYSTDFGGTWQTPILVAPDMLLATTLSLAATSSGYVATWQDSSGNAMSSYSTNLTTWSSPVAIASNLDTDFTDVEVSGSGSNFIASWHTSDNNAAASLSTDGGVSWGTPVLITMDGTVALHPPIYNSFVGVSLVSDSYAFVWVRDSGGNVDPYSSFSPLGSGYIPPQSNAPFFKTVTIPSSQGGLFR